MDFLATPAANSEILVEAVSSTASLLLAELFGAGAVSFCIPAENFFRFDDFVSAKGLEISRA